MKKRIIKYEKMFEEIENSYKNLEKAFHSFIDKEDKINELNTYYGSNNWFSDIEEFDKKKMAIKAGILSQDGIWNLLENINELKTEMKEYLDN